MSAMAIFDGKQCPEAKCPTSIRRARRGQSERAVRQYSALISSSRKYFMATQMSRDLCPVASCDFAASKRYHDLFLFLPPPVHSVTALQKSDDFWMDLRERIRLLSRHGFVILDQL